MVIWKLENFQMPLQLGSKQIWISDMEATDSFLCAYRLKTGDI
jgi:hypothetical protein